jgi:hypothetical protein
MRKLRESRIGRVESSGRSTLRRTERIMDSVMDMIKDTPSQKRKLEVSELTRDNSYQREPSLGFVKTVVDHFIPALVGYISVALRSSGLYVIDGWHRVLALRDLDKRTVFGFVFSEMTPEQEALMFLGLNRFNRKPSALEVFHAARVGREPTACSINKTVNKVGLVIPRSNGNTENHIYCISALESLFVRGGEPVIWNTLDVLKKSWEPKEPSKFCRNLVMGAGFLFLHAELRKLLDPGQLTRALRRTSPVRLLIDAETQRDALAPERRPYVVTEQIINAYNRSVRGKSRKLPSYFEK